MLFAASRNRVVGARLAITPDSSVGVSPSGSAQCAGPRLHNHVDCFLFADDSVGIGCCYGFSYGQFASEGCKVTPIRRPSQA